MSDKRQSIVEQGVEYASNAGDVPEKHGAQVQERQGDAHFHDTVTAAPLNPWSKTSIQLYFILLVAALNATSSGFDGVCLSHKYNLIRYLTE